MFVCYLDDSGKDHQNPIAALGGYVAREAAWALFERNVEPVFKEFSVEVLHAVNLHNTKGDFKLWTRDRKEEFVSRVCEAMAPNVPLGISFSVDKENYEARRKESRAQGTDKQDTPYTYCFRAIIHWLIEQPEICAVGVSFVLECGHQNNRKARDDFQKMRQQGLEGVLGTISFPPPPPMLSKIPAQSSWPTCLHTTRVGISSGSKNTHTKTQNEIRFWISSLKERFV